MIEKMKAVSVVSSASRKAELLNRLKELGVFHISEKKSADSALLARFEDLNRNFSALKEIEGSSYEKKVLSENDFEELDKKVTDSRASITRLSDERTKCLLAADRIRAWGYFNPSDLLSLKDEGLEIHVYRMGKKDLEKLRKDENVRFIKLSSVEKMETVAVIGDKLDNSVSATEFELPEKGLSDIEKRIGEIDSELSQCRKNLTDASSNLASYKFYILKCSNDITYSSADCTLESEDGLVWLSGYIPADNCKEFTDAAQACSWAYIMDDPKNDDEKVPTKVRYNKITTLMEPVFDILGTIPGYREYDISFWFLCFFALFFAMIIGDAGYGFCFLAVALGLHFKQKKATNLVLLIYVMSFATIAWGAVTGTWFGLEEAMSIPLLKKLVIPQIANYPEYFGYTAVQQQNTIMKFCFMIGTIQLSLACVMNVWTKLGKKDLSFIADIGWLLSINALYYVVLLLVVNAEISLVPVALVILAGFVLVVLFGGMSPEKTFAQGLKAGLADAFTVFLNTISAFGNIMSYIRLFAVGLASLAIAQSFNNMALGFNGWLKVAGILIFVIGHALNLVMGLLSVVVHGVRLNLLEFSGQLGMEWTGVAYEPFKEKTK
ncbi:MAG: ATPase [Sphaerochaetaceae bacterium]|nr:ATPase [Sphaerochaetaceae bacterium]